MTAASFSRRSWSETTAGGGAIASGETGEIELDEGAVAATFAAELLGVDAPVAVAVECDDDD